MNSISRQGYAPEADKPCRPIVPHYNIRAVWRRHFIFSRSYCYKVLSASGKILSSLWRFSVRLSATLCIVALRVGVHCLKLYQRVPIAGKFLFVRSSTFAMGYMQYDRLSEQQLSFLLKFIIHFNNLSQKVFKCRTIGRTIISKKCINLSI